MTLHSIFDVFSGAGSAASYTLVVDGGSYKVPANKVTKSGDVEFKLPKMSSGDKVGYAYAQDSKGNSLDRADVYFDVDDITAPVANGKLAVTQHGNDFDLSWAAATDESPYEWTLIAKDGKNIVWQKNDIDGSHTGAILDLNNMAPISGKKLTFELFAHQDVKDKGAYVTLTSKTLTASATLATASTTPDKGSSGDKEAPTLLVPGKVFSDWEHAEAAKLSDDAYWDVSDPIHQGKGTLGLYEVDQAFTDNVGIKTYELVVDGKTFKTAASKMADYGLVEFSLTGMGIGDKQGLLYAVDAAGNRSAGISVFFDSDNKQPKS